MSKTMARFTKPAALALDVAQEAPRNGAARKRYSARLQAVASANSTTTATNTVTANCDSTSSSDGYNSDDSDRSWSSRESQGAAKTTATRKPKRKVKQVSSSTDEMTEEEKRLDRARRNRASALKSRNKRRQRLAYLEVEFTRLTARIEDLERENAKLKLDNSHLRHRPQQHAHTHGVEADAPFSSAPAPALEPLVAAHDEPCTKRARPTRLSANRLTRHSSTNSALGGSKRSPSALPFADFLDFDATIDMVGADLTFPADSDWSAIDAAAVLDEPWPVSEPATPRTPATPAPLQQHFVVPTARNSDCNPFDRLIAA